MNCMARPMDSSKTRQGITISGKALLGDRTLCSHLQDMVQVQKDMLAHTAHTVQIWPGPKESA